jgi:demethylmenaquinone methyltransferase/2-methoxy-6-polyprenyl-1,4-benzoquinol methylase
MGMRDRIATADGKRLYVRGLFATIADRYDLITIVLSYGQDRRWKHRLLDLANPCRARLVSRPATISRSSSRRAAPRRPRCDTRMIELARAKAPAGCRPHSSWATCCAAISSGSFDFVTTGYGLRNVRTRAGDRRMLRVLSRGQALSLDFDRPGNALVRSAYLSYLTIVGGLLGWLLHRDPDTYRYIPASIRQYPGAGKVGRLMETRGFSQARHYRVLGGLMAIHHAVK